MKSLILFTLFISQVAHAIDFNKVTGTFDPTERKLDSDIEIDPSFGSFSPTDTEKSMRALATVKQEDDSTSINELTGTFEYQND